MTDRMARGLRSQEGVFARLAWPARAFEAAWGVSALPVLATGRGAGGRLTMLYYALVFLIVGLVAGALGLAGIASVAAHIAWILFLIGVVLLVIHLVNGRRTVL